MQQFVSDLFNDFIKPTEIALDHVVEVTTTQNKRKKELLDNPKKCIDKVIDDENVAAALGIPRGFVIKNTPIVKLLDHVFKGDVIETKFKDEPDISVYLTHLHGLLKLAWSKYSYLLLSCISTPGFLILEQARRVQSNVKDKYMSGITISNAFATTLWVKHMNKDYRFPPNEDNDTGDDDEMILFRWYDELESPFYTTPEDMQRKTHDPWKRISSSEIDIHTKGVIEEKVKLVHHYADIHHLLIHTVLGRYMNELVPLPIPDSETSSFKKEITRLKELRDFIQKQEPWDKVKPLSWKLWLSEERRKFGLVLHGKIDQVLANLASDSRAWEHLATWLTSNQPHVFATSSHNSSYFTDVMSASVASTKVSIIDEVLKDHLPTIQSLVSSLPKEINTTSFDQYLTNRVTYLTKRRSECATSSLSNPNAQSERERAFRKEVKLDTDRWKQRVMSSVVAKINDMIRVSSNPVQIATSLRSIIEDGVASRADEMAGAAFNLQTDELRNIQSYEGTEDANELAKILIAIQHSLEHFFTKYVQGKIPDVSSSSAATESVVNLCEQFFSADGIVPSSVAMYGIDATTTLPADVRARISTRVRDSNILTRAPILLSDRRFRQRKLIIELFTDVKYQQTSCSVREAWKVLKAIWFVCVLVQSTHTHIHHE